MRLSLRSVALGALLFLCVPLFAETKTLAATPPMGWNSWNYFAVKVTDADIRATADALVASGMRDAGYIYVSIDDSWEGKRDADGNIHSNSKFPDMKGLADYLHARGLKLGIYSSPGPLTCEKYEGSYGHEEADARTYADWGVDLLKYDLCSFQDVMKEKAPGNPSEQNRLMRDAFEKMHQALLKTKRPILYSLCQYGVDSVWQWGPEVGAQMWRNTGDIKNNYDRMLIIAMAQMGLSKYAGPGGWNDMDILEVGNGVFTKDEAQTHMTLWAMLAAPLLAGNNLAKMDETTKAILTNREVIEIDQDSMGKGGNLLYAEGPVQIWTRPLADGSVAMAILNTGFDRTDMHGVTLHLNEAGFPKGAHARDIWNKTDLGLIQDTKQFIIPKHSVVLLKLTR